MVFVKILNIIICKGIKMNFKNIITFSLCIFLSSCLEMGKIFPPNVQTNTSNVSDSSAAIITAENTNNQNVNTQNFVPVYKKLPSRTFEHAEKFNLETPLRCEVDWSTQNIISTQPYNLHDFRLERVDRGDPLPDLTVKNLSFKHTSIDKIISSILKNTGIKLKIISTSPEISVDNISGNLETVLSLITSLADVYYSYDNRTKTISIDHIAKWNLHVPLSKEVILGMEDALRGIGTDDIVIDWQDRVLIFSGNFLVENRVRKIINKFAIEDYLIAYDIDIFRVYPKNPETSIKWMDVIPAFNHDSVKLSKKGIIGRALVVSSNFNTASLKEFLYPRANSVLVSSGTFIVPNRWQGRFDIGRCGRENRLETDLNIVTQTKYKQDDKYVGKLDSIFALRTNSGDITNFNLPSRLGENIVIIGIPTQYFIKEEETTIPPNAELVTLISPRIIKIVRDVDTGSIK